jgi:hypothetical protein
MAVLHRDIAGRLADDLKRGLKAGCKNIEKVLKFVWRRKCGRITVDDASSWRDQLSV